jgi:predicted RNase H-like nuclease (RuvC/YqgF family)
MIYGIDPGAKTGFAEFYEGKLIRLFTVEAEYGFEILRDLQIELAILEDSTLTSYIFTAPGVPHRAALKIARNIGEVDAYCKAIKAVLGHMVVPYKSISPKQKGKKLNAKEFQSLTGWAGKSNQHERDAAVTAWNYRHAKKD